MESTATTSSPRQSTTELIRLAAMLMIVMHHFVVHALYPEALSLEIEGQPWDTHLFTFLQGFLYIGLMLLAPILNTAIDHFSRRTFRYVMGLLLVINVWFGYINRADKFLPTGYSILQFVWIYLLGTYLRRYCSDDWLRTHRGQMLWLYVGCATLYELLLLVRGHGSQFGFAVPLFSPYNYNSPLLVAAAVGCFLFMQSFNFQSGVINWLASSVLAAYIVQESIFRYYWLADAAAGWGMALKAVAVIALSVAFLLGVILFDKARILLLKPFWRWYDHRIEPRLMRLIQTKNATV